MADGTVRAANSVRIPAEGCSHGQLDGDKNEGVRHGFLVGCSRCVSRCNSGPFLVAHPRLLTPMVMMGGDEYCCLGWVLAV